MPDLTETEIASTDFGTYTEEQFYDDMGRNSTTEQTQN